MTHPSRRRARRRTAPTRLATGQGAATTAALHLTGVASEEASFVTLTYQNVNMQGLLLAGILIGSRGVLDDVTVTQAVTISEVAAANPAMGRVELNRAGARVGRSHIVSVVNTIVLAYAGASLPLLILWWEHRPHWASCSPAKCSRIPPQAVSPTDRGLDPWRDSDDGWLGRHASGKAATRARRVNLRANSPQWTTMRPDAGHAPTCCFITHRLRTTMCDSLPMPRGAAEPIGVLLSGRRSAGSAARDGATSWWQLVVFAVLMTAGAAGVYLILMAR